MVRVRVRVRVRSARHGRGARRPRTHSAANLCPKPPRQVLDVFELDRLAGYYLEKKLANFHVPPRASAQAALALLLQLRLGVGATRGEHSRKATSARAPR